MKNIKLKTMNAKITLLTCSIFLLGFSSFAQKDDDSELERVEIKVKGADDYYVVPVGDEGVVMFYETDEKGESKGEREWVFTKYNTSFKEDWDEMVSIDRWLTLKKFTYDGKFLYTLFHATGASSSDYKLIKIDVKNGSITDIGGKSLNFSEIDMCNMGNASICFGGTSVPNQYLACAKVCLAYSTCFIPFFLGLNPNNTNPVVYYTDFSDDLAELKAIKIKGGSKVSDITYDNYSKSANIIILNKYNKVNYTYVYELDVEGDFISDYKIDSKGGNLITSGKITSLSANEKIMIGTYTKPLKDKNFVAKFMTNTMFRSYVGPAEVAHGLYITKLIDNEQEFIKYYGFENFDEALIAISAGSEKRTKKKLAKRKEKGKDITFSYRLLVHDLIKQDDITIMVAEAYYPEYHTEYYTTTNSQGQTTTQSRQVFDGWRYTHAIAAGFDKDGEMVWDHSFKIQDILTMNLKERVKVMIQEEEIVLAYSHGGYIKSKILSGSDILDGKRSVKIEFNRKYKKSSTNYDEELDFWYDNYFLASGKQQLVKKRSARKKGEKRKSTVFYFSKIAFE